MIQDEVIPALNAVIASPVLDLLAKPNRVTALMETVENQKQVYHRCHRPWKSPQDFHTPTAGRLLFK